MHAAFCLSPPKGGSNRHLREAHNDGTFSRDSPFKKGSANMLHGFSVPLTPQGNSALASPPPWHYSSDCLAIEYWTDPAAVAALLPSGLTPDKKSRGRFVDNDAAIARGWAQGFPKKYGSIYQTRSFSAPSAAASPLATGSRFGASVAAHGERLATARLQLEEKVADPAKVFNQSKTDLADKLTAFHAEYAGVPKTWVHIVFAQTPLVVGAMRNRRAR
jgi:Acetoacetate decarboxylase (ADC)